MADQLNPVIQDIAEALQAARKKKGMSQRALSKRVGLPQSHLSRIENGAVDLQLSSLIELARALGLELVLVPRHRVPAVQSIISHDTASPSQRPAYSLDEEEDADG